MNEVCLKDLEGEIWKVISYYEGDYQVSNIGRVKSLKFGKERILKQQKRGDYFCVDLCKNGISKHKLIHRLVYEAHIGKLEDGYDAHHINENKEDNFIENLESKPHDKHIGDHSRNRIILKEARIKQSKTMKEKFKNGELNFKGENHNHKLTEEQVIQIKLLLREGKLTQREIADMFGVKQASISNIKTGKLWSHIRIGEF